MKLLVCGLATAAPRTSRGRQRAKGLPTTAALVVLARKLVRVAFSLFKQQKALRPFATTNRFGKLTWTLEAQGERVKGNSMGD